MITYLKTPPCIFIGVFTNNVGQRFTQVWLGKRPVSETRVIG